MQDFVESTAGRAGRSLKTNAEHDLWLNNYHHASWRKCTVSLLCSRMSRIMSQRLEGMPRARAIHTCVKQYFDAFSITTSMFRPQSQPLEPGCPPSSTGFIPHDGRA